MNDTPSNPNNPGTGRQSGAGAKARRLLPLTVWLCSDTSTNTHSHDADPPGHSGRAPARLRESELCVRHKQSVGGELARHLISTCTRQGDVVVEAFTTGEATMVAAAELDRRVVALVPHFPLARHIGSKVRAVLPENQLPRVAMRPCRPDQMARGLADHLGEVGLVIAAPPAYETGGRLPQKVGERGCPACRADLWRLPSEQLDVFLAAAWKVLRPGGVLAVITTARHRAHRLVDPAPRIIRLAQGLGFGYVQHVIALRVPIEGDALVVQSEPADLAQLRDVDSRALPPAVTVHADVCLFTKPATRPLGSPETNGDAR